MLEILVILLLILWVLGLAFSTSMGGSLHIILVVAVVGILAWLIPGQGNI